MRAGVTHAAGIPGHGVWTLTDALLDRPEIRTIQVMHEQSAVHLADGYYRASGKPMLAFTSIGPGATNTVIGMATAYVDSTAVALFTGSTHTYMRGHGVLQELERRHHADNPRIFEPVVKEWWQPSRVDELPFVLHRAWNAMTSGRPGPVLMDVPMDVQAEAAEVVVPEPDARQARGRPRPDPAEVERAAALLTGAKRPVIVAGGGVIGADASEELRALAERLGAPVVTTWNGKGAIDETHPLAGQTIGDTGSTIGNALAASADVILSVGCRFVDWSASSWRKGVTFAIPPTQLIQLEIDAREIGKNYPVAVPLLGDARAGLADLLAALGSGKPTAGYGDEIDRLRGAWHEQVEVKSGSEAAPMTMARALREVQAATREDAIVVTGAGLPQGMVKQRWVTRAAPHAHHLRRFLHHGIHAPRCHRRTAGATRRAGAGGLRRRRLPAVDAGASGGRAGRHAGLHRRARQLGLDQHQGRAAGALRPDRHHRLRPRGQPYSPDFAAIARAFDIHAEFADAPADVRPAVERALASGGPSLVHVKVDRDLAVAGPDKTGWWDVPVPEGRPVYDEQLAGRAEEQHR